MKLHLLIPTLQYSCSVALGSHLQGTLGERAALIVAFDKNHSPQILFFADTNHPKLPPDFVYGIAFVDSSLHSICTTINRLELPHETAVERMVFHVLSHMHVLLHSLKPAHELTLQLAGMLDHHAVCGISGAIAREKFPEQTAPLVPALNQRN